MSPKMIKLGHDQVLWNESQIGEGTFVGMKELYRKGKTRDHILHTHEAYINSHVSVELRGVDLHDLDEPATQVLCQSMLINTINACINVNTKLNLLNVSSWENSNQKQLK